MIPISNSVPYIRLYNSSVMNDDFHLKFFSSWNAWDAVAFYFFPFALYFKFY